MRNVYLSYNNIVSPLGFDSATVVENVRNGISGISRIDDPNFFAKPFYGSIIDLQKIDENFSKISSEENFTKLEKMMILSLKNVIDTSKVTISEKTGFIISTTKGNIDALSNKNEIPEDRAYLGELGKTIKEYFSFKNEAIVLSNACVSGLLAIATAKRYIEMDVYDEVFITSGDLVSEFVLAGFNSFQAMSDAHCRPYDKVRNGINIGEAAASILVTSKKENLSQESVQILGEGSANDANHISGPSRTGEGLYRSIQSAFKEAQVERSEIDYISAHGTATSFNDEMEAIAFNRCGLSNTPMNSLKGYFGHTLGASGLLETIVSMHSLHQNTLFTSKGFKELGVSEPLNVIKKIQEKQLNIFLKTASGFGGSNTAAIFRKVMK